MFRLVLLALVLCVAACSNHAVGGDGGIPPGRDAGPVIVPRDGRIVGADRGWMRDAPRPRDFRPVYDHGPIHGDGPVYDVSWPWPDWAPPPPPPIDGGLKKCGPYLGGQCPWNMVCNIKGCYPGATGFCTLKPYSCSKIWKPVCGCNGNTYGNDCHRLKAGVALKHTGACLVPPDAFVWPDMPPPPPPPVDSGPPLCGPWPGGQCPWSMVCDIHACYPGAPGKCLPKPSVCPKLWAPVCGCDGYTYANDCYRLQAGVARKHTGACSGSKKDSGPFPDAPQGCAAGKCSPGMVCDIKGCYPGASGTCVPKPKSCPFPWDPVCGCNNLTYVNDCNRLIAGAALKHKGVCSTLDAGVYVD